MTEPAVHRTIDDLGRVTLTLDRPAVRNAFDDALIGELLGHLRELDVDPSVRVVLLAATGPAFSAGADLGWMRRMADYTYDENLADALGLADLMRTLAGLSKPTLALVQGPALGGGVGLVSCCDIALAVESATFCLSEARLGLVPAVISPYVIGALGFRAAKRYALTAEVFDAHEAHRLGLVHDVLPDAEALATRADALSRLLVNNGPTALMGVKRLFPRVAASPVDDELVTHTAETIAACRAGDEAREGLAAFFDKRRPDWAKG